MKEVTLRLVRAGAMSLYMDDDALNSIPDLGVYDGVEIELNGYVARYAKVGEEFRRVGYKPCEIRILWDSVVALQIENVEEQEHEEG